MDNSKNYYALHAVIFKKKNGWDYDKAEKEVNNYIKSNKKHFYRETNSSYRFRNIPKQKFISKTFRTKNLKNGISLIMGELKPESRHLEGAGIFDLFKKPIKTVKDFFSPRQGYNNTTTKNLNQYGNIPIKRLTIVRTPIMGILDKALNLISFGKWSQLKKEYGHDKLFHLALIANLGTKNLVIEKNEVINVNTSFKMGNESETLDVDLKGKTFTVNEMLNATRKIMGDSNFFSYNGMSNNCQTFIKNCLISVGLYDLEENTFVFQDLNELSKKFPSISKKIMNATTKLGAIANKLTGQGEGGGEKEENNKLHKKEITSINDLTLKQIRKLADEFNKHMQILNMISKSKKNLVEELEHHLEVINGELQLKPYIFELMQKKKTGEIDVEVEIKRLQGILDELNAEYNPNEERRSEKEAELKEEYKKKFGYGKMSLKDEFKMDEKDHEKKLDDFEYSNPSNEKIKETLAGLKSITESGLTHIKKLEEMLSLNGGSAKSAGFIRAIMARREAKKEGKELTRDSEFKNYEKSGFKEQKLNRSSKYLVNMFDDGIYKKLVLNFAILNENYLYNTKGIREIYEKDPEKAKKAIDEVDGVIGDEKKIMDGIKKQIPNYDDLTDVEKTVYMINYKQAVRASILGKFFDGIKPIEVDKTEELKERMKQNYIRWYNKNKKSKKGKKETKQYDELLEKIEGLDEGDELEIPIPTKGKKETVIELEDQIKENKKEKRKKTDEKTPSEDRNAIDDALMEFMKRTKKETPKKKQEDDFEDLLAQSGLTLDDLNF